MMNDSKTKNKTVLKATFEWVWLILAVGIFYFFGLHIWLQRLILWTGIYQAPTEIADNQLIRADYDFELIDSQGKTLDFKDLEGKTIFLNLWATWCPPCVAEMPNIQALYQDLKKENIAFVMISVDENPLTAQKFLAKNAYELPVYFLNSSLPKIYNHSNSIPRTYVINPQGRIVSQHSGMANYNTEKFKQFLRSLSK